MHDPSALLRRLACVAFLALAAVAAVHGPAAAEGEVNIYSYREPGLINPLLEAFTKATGIKANVVFAKDGLIERLAAEARSRGQSPPSCATPTAAGSA
jgi:iron(III) transport system substrate-binding protein